MFCIHRHSMSHGTLQFNTQCVQCTVYGVACIDVDFNRPYTKTNQEHSNVWVLFELESESETVSNASGNENENEKENEKEREGRRATKRKTIHFCEWLSFCSYLLGIITSLHPRGSMYTYCSNEEVCIDSDLLIASKLVNVSAVIDEPNANSNLKSSTFVVLFVVPLCSFVIIIAICVVLCCVDCCLFEFILCDPHTYANPLNVHVSQRFHSNKRIFDYVWLKINSSLRCVVVCSWFVVCSFSFCFAVPPKKNDDDDGEWKNKRAWAWSGPSYIQFNVVCNVKAFYMYTSGHNRHIQTQPILMSLLIRWNARRQARGNAFTCVILTSKQVTRFSLLSCSSIQCSCHSTGRVLSYYRFKRKKKDEDFVRVPPYQIEIVKLSEWYISMKIS